MAYQSETKNGGSATDSWLYSKPTSLITDPNSFYWFVKPALGGNTKQSPEFSGSTQQSVNQTSPWSNATYTKDAISRRLGDTSVSQQSTPAWTPKSEPVIQPISGYPHSSPPTSDLTGGFNQPLPPARTQLPTWGTPESNRPSMLWQQVGPIRGNALNPIHPAVQSPQPQTGSPIIDIVPTTTAPSAPTAPANVRAGGPSGFTEQFTAPTVAMPSVDKLYQTYQEVFGRQDQGARDYLNSPQFQGMWQSGNIPLWMLSDPLWRNYLVKIGLLNWDAINKRLSQ